MKREYWIAGILLLLSIRLHADTYNERTLVRIELPVAADREFVQASPIDVVNAGPGWAKALLRPNEFRLLADRGIKVEILWDEMERDRALWRAADEAAAAHVPNFAYYTASHFNVVNPPAGSLMEHLLALHNAHPDITRLYDIGDTATGNYDIIAMQVSDNPDVEENEPKIRIYGNIHGDEKSALMVPCDVLDWILNNYPSNPDAVRLVQDAELWFIPMGNPDGNAASSRYNGHGVDLNRNFWGPDGNEDGTPFSEPETQAIRDLTEVRGKRFAASISFHAGEICFNSVYNYTSAATTDEPIFFSSRTGGPNGGATPSPYGLAQAYQNGCTTPGFWYTNGADWYITRGDTNDWSYAVWSDLDTTLELTLVKTPPTSAIPGFCAEHRQAVINYMLATFQGISGRMTDASTSSPLDGTVVATATASAYITVPHQYQEVYTDPDVGDYHRVLQPATYTVQCAAPGHEPFAVQGVIVSAGATTVVDCPMQPCTVPSIVTDPASQSILSGQTANMSVSASGAGTLSYQWYRGVSGNTLNPIAGAVSSTYTTPPLTTTTSYWVRVTNDCGSVDSATATITVCTPAFITHQPASQTITGGQTATLLVSVGGDFPRTYQWYAGASGDTSNPIPGAVSSGYITPPLVSTKNYWVRVANGCGSADSDTATITVVPACTYFCDDFEDTDDSGWTFKGGTWNPASPDLIATTTRSAMASSPSFAAPSIRSVEANVTLVAGGTRLSVFGWWLSKSENVELKLMQDQGKLLLIQRAGGASKKSKAVASWNTGQSYNLRMVYDGSNISIYLDGSASPILSMTPLASPQGGTALKIKATAGFSATGSMSDIAVN